MRAPASRPPGIPDAVGRRARGRDRTAPDRGRGRRPRLVQRLFAPVDAASLGAFRVAFGLLLAAEAWRLVSGGWVERDWVLPRFTFPYELFPFVRPWPEPFMTVHVALMGAAALGPKASSPRRSCARWRSAPTCCCSTPTTSATG